MIYNVIVNNNDGELVDVYRIGAWYDDHAEDWVATQIVKEYGVNAPNMVFTLIPEGRLLLMADSEEIESAREEFFQSILDTPEPIW